MTDTAPDKQLLRSANEQIKAVRRERDELAQQIRLSQETIARSQALIARLDKLLRDLEGHELGRLSWRLRHRPLPSSLPSSPLQLKDNCVGP